MRPKKYPAEVQRAVLEITPTRLDPQSTTVTLKAIRYQARRRLAEIDKEPRREMLQEPVNTGGRPASERKLLADIIAEIGNPDGELHYLLARDLLWSNREIKEEIETAVEARKERKLPQDQTMGQE